MFHFSFSKKTILFSFFLFNLNLSFKMETQKNVEFEFFFIFESENWDFVIAFKITKCIALHYVHLKRKVKWKVISEWKICALSSQEGQKFHFEFSKIKSTIRCNVFLENLFLAFTKGWLQHPTHAWYRPRCEFPRLDVPQKYSRRNTQFVCCHICNLTSEAEEKLEQIWAVALKCVRKPAYETDLAAALADSAPLMGPTRWRWPLQHDQGHISALLRFLQWFLNVSL